MRVLVIEDVQSLADDIAEGLRYHGIAADVAYDGLDAVAKLDATAYHVVVLDRDLPGIHGDALCQIITQAGKLAMVLMLTAAGSPEDRVSGLDLGADDYLAKPFHFPELVREPPRASVGRARRPVHQRRLPHHQPATPQTRSAPRHRNPARCRLSHHRCRYGRLTRAPTPEAPIVLPSWVVTSGRPPFSAMRRTEGHWLAQAGSSRANYPTLPGCGKQVATHAGNMYSSMRESGTLS